MNYFIVIDCAKVKP